MADKLRLRSVKRLVLAVPQLRALRVAAAMGMEPLQTKTLCACCPRIVATNLLRRRISLQLGAHLPPLLVRSSPGARVSLIVKRPGENALMNVSKN